MRRRLQVASHQAAVGSRHASEQCPSPVVQDMVYRSDRNLAEQQGAGTAGGVDWEAADFERRLKERTQQG